MCKASAFLAERRKIKREEWEVAVLAMKMGMEPIPKKAKNCGFLNLFLFHGL
jgi:hypothetical protein